MVPDSSSRDNGNSQNPADTDPTAASAPPNQKIISSLLLMTTAIIVILFNFVFT